MTAVTIVGGGLAGLTTALRLTERGYRVKLYERQPVLGGNVATRSGPDGVGQDVYPHMYLNWYHNIWALVADITDVPRDEMFAPISSIRRLVKGEFPRFTALTDTYSPWHALQNLFSGAAPPADMFLFMYASVDLLAEHLNPTVLLDDLSVNGFLHARPYVTERAARLFDTWIQLVWSNPSYLTSAADYQTFLKHGYAEPVPALWLLRGTAADSFLDPIASKLQTLGSEVRLSEAVTAVACDGGRVTEISVRSKGGEERTEPVEELVLAVPPGALSHLIRTGPPGRRIVNAAPVLAEVARLRTEAIPMVQLVFTRKLEHIPLEPVSLVGSRSALGFTDVSQTPSDSSASSDRTVVALSASDRYALPGTGAEDDAMAMIRELAEYVPGFDPGTRWGESSDIDWARTSVDLNVDTRLFVNQTGSDLFRPRAGCDTLPNLHLAGDFCENHIGLTCIEAAVVTGLNAAQSVVKQRGGERVPVVEPRDFPALLFAWLRFALAPYAAAAKTWSSGSDLVCDALRRLNGGRSALRYLFGATPSRRQR